MSLKFELKQFNDTLRRCVAASSRAAHIVVNNHAYAATVAAAHHTKIGDKQRIRYVLGEAHGPAAPTKAGKQKKAQWRQLVYREDSFAARIINARRVKDGKKPLFGAKLDERIRKMIIARGASVGFIASGFVRAARQLRRFTKGIQLKETPKGIKVIPGGPSGKGIPAKAPAGILGSGTIVARIENDVVTAGGRWQAEGMTFNPLPIAEAGMIRGLQIENTSMKLHLSTKRHLGEELRKAGAL